jgi:hypothetical protein
VNILFTWSKIHCAPDPADTTKMHPVQMAIQKKGNWGKPLSLMSSSKKELMSMTGLLLTEFNRYIPVLLINISKKPDKGKPNKYNNS